MAFNMTNKEKADGSWSFVDQDEQPITDETLLTGWAATFESSSPGSVEVVPLESNPESKLGCTVLSKLNGEAVITSVLTGPEGQTFTGTETVRVINSAPNRPVFTFSQPRPEAPQG